MVDAATNTVEVPEPAVKADATPAPTREALKAEGWSKEEMDAAEKRGMVAKEEGKPAEPAKAQTEAPKPEERVAAEEAKAPKPEQRRGSSLPDFTIADPAQEKVFVDTFGPGSTTRALYFRMKNERTQRQAAEAERQRLVEENETLKKKLETPGKRDAIDALLEDPADDEKPVTWRELKAKEDRERAESEEREQKLSQRAAVIVEAQTVQEEYAKTIYEDFDATVDLAKDLMKNLNSHVPEKWKQAKAVKLMRDLQAAAQNADQVDVEGYTAAMIAYELGQLHPQYGKDGRSAEVDGAKNPAKVNGGLTPGQMKRIEENAQRRASSASIPGGGHKSVAADDVTLADINRMSAKQRLDFREKYPDRYEKLLRG